MATLGMDSSDGRKIMTLVVEDNVSFRKYFKESLQNRFPSMVIEEAGDGDEVLQKVEELCPALIFMDIRLPGENGLQLTKRIKKKHSDIKIVILTTYDLPEYREAALQYGANSFMTKDSLSWEEIDALIKSISPGSN
ncbi:MAG: response regulator transcription factor [Thermodesulfobacteriota bacterium]